MSEQARCALCGEPMPPGEEMFNFHGYSGNCPKPAHPTDTGMVEQERLREQYEVIKPMRLDDPQLSVQVSNTGSGVLHVPD
jgi:hypothetical protein